ncbi:hypothetical protein [Bacillus thuringiensis]|uniref:hypothetical protein n=1 Tax=Bacillus thuringiensis TaxID=1428 RepID=UPI0026E39056|nr:hypothetical protein [Bacillus thuringiensis]MDO6631782.1 hypothetical protein [Bacillus thuringiensis]MDO6661387.1 hypothetical protein [Bacillus thuringiensis]MDO6701922.1 hypothetical protein [Bacillus thuringiensis]
MEKKYERIVEYPGFLGYDVIDFKVKGKGLYFRLYITRHDLLEQRNQEEQWKEKITS